MQQCPNCGMFVILPEIQTCLGCGTQLESLSRNQADDEYTISIHLNFTIYICDQCGAANHYGSVKCVACGADLRGDDSESLVSGSPDPIAVARREALTELVKMRTQMLKELEEARVYGAVAQSVPSEEAYRQRYLKLSERFLEQTTVLRELLSSIDFGEKALATPKFRSQVQALEESYGNLLETTKKVLSLKPHPMWATLHDKFVSATEQALRSYLGVVDVLLAQNTSEASDFMAQINKQFGEAGRVIERSQVVFAGKRLRYDQTPSVPAAVASLVAEGLDMLALWDMGWDYFGDLFLRDIKEIPREYGFILAIWAVIAESFNDPNLLKQRAAVVADLCRQADAADRPSLNAVTSRLEADVLHASRLLVNIGLQFAATDFSKLHPQQVFDMGIHAYQRLSEGSFKNLLTILLFCEELVAGRIPDYDEISRRGFGAKTQSLQRSSQPVLAGLATDLVLYVRHADAHCDFYPEADKIVIHERRWPSNEIIASHEYTEDKFVELIQRMVEAVFAISIGVDCFRIESYEEYLSTDSMESLLEYEKFELGKYSFATRGIIVHSIQRSDRNSGKPDLTISASLAEGIELTPEALLIPMKILSDSFPNAVRLTVELCDANSNATGTLTVPATHFRKYLGPGRAGELVLLELRYNSLTRYVDPSNLFYPELSEEEVYHWHFLKPVSVYLTHILQDCFQAARLESRQSPNLLKTLDQELTLLQRILAGNKPPQRLQHYHAIAVRATSIANDFIRKYRLSMRRKARSKTKNLEAILQKAIPLSIELLEFLRQVEQEQALP